LAQARGQSLETGKKGTWYANFARFSAKSEFWYCSNGDRVNARGNAQIRATAHFLWEE